MASTPGSRLPDGLDAKDDAAARRHRARRLRPRHGLLRRRHGVRPHAALVLLPDPRPDPGGRAPPRRRRSAASASSSSCSARGAPARRRDPRRSAPGPDALTRTPRRRLEVAVLAGGLSHERDVSLRSGRRVAEALRSVGHRGLRPRRRRRPGPCADAGCAPTSCGRCCTVPAARTARSVTSAGPARHPGARHRPRARAGSRGASRSRRRSSPAAGVATPDFVDLPAVAVPRARSRRGPRPARRHGWDSRSWSSRRGWLGPGRRRSSTTHDELPRAMVDCFSYSDTALVEQCGRSARGRGVASSTPATVRAPCLPSRSSPIGPYDYDARYNPGRTGVLRPGPARPASVAVRVGEVAVIAARGARAAPDLADRPRSSTPRARRGSSRSTRRPGMTETSLLPQSAEPPATTSGVVPIAGAGFPVVRQTPTPRCTARRNRDVLPRAGPGTRRVPRRADQRRSRPGSSGARISRIRLRSWTVANSTVRRPGPCRG